MTRFLVALSQYEKNKHILFHIHFTLLWDVSCLATRPPGHRTSPVSEWFNVKQRLGITDFCCLGGELVCLGITHLPCFLCTQSSIEVQFIARLTSFRTCIRPCIQMVSQLEHLDTGLVRYPNGPKIPG